MRVGHRACNLDAFSKYKVYVATLDTRVFKVSVLPPSTQNTHAVLNSQKMKHVHIDVPKE